MPPAGSRPWLARERGSERRARPGAPAQLGAAGVRTAPDPSCEPEEEAGSGDSRGNALTAEA